MKDKLDKEPFEEACEEDKDPREDDELMESVEADNSLSCDSKVDTSRMESFKKDEMMT